MTDSSSLLALHARLLGDHGLQFGFSTRATPRYGHAPEWLTALARLVGAAVRWALPALDGLFWIGVAAAVLCVALLIAREAFGIRLGDRRKAPSPRAATADWRAEVSNARALLENADRLASVGDYGRAARLILHRGVEDIEARRPRLIRPAFTARDIAGLDAIPVRAREAFTLIGGAVEASLFGARMLGPEDYARCRQAYERFAFPEGWG